MLNSLIRYSNTSFKKKHFGVNSRYSYKKINSVLFKTNHKINTQSYKLSSLSKVNFCNMVYSQRYQYSLLPQVYKSDIKKDAQYSDYEKQELKAWLNANQLFKASNKDTYLETIATYIKNCAPSWSTKTQRLLAAKFLAVYFYFNDLDYLHENTKLLLLDCQKICNGEETPHKELQAILRGFQESSKREIENPYLYKQFQLSFCNMFQIFVDEAALIRQIKSGVKISLTEYETLAFKTIITPIYIKLWQGLGGLESYKITDDHRLQVAKINRYENDLYSRVRFHKIDFQSVYTQNYNVSIDAANEKLSSLIDENKHQFYATLAELNNSEEVLIKDYANLLQVCVEGNLRSMQEIPKRYQVNKEVISGKSVVDVFLERQANDDEHFLDKAYDFLDRNGTLYGYQSITSPGSGFEKSIYLPIEIFTTMFVLDLDLKDLNVDMRQLLLSFIQKFRKGDRFNFFPKADLIPDDVDCTAIGFSTLKKYNLSRNGSLINVANRIIENTNEEGVIQTYFPPRNTRENRLDPVVCANVLYFLWGTEYNEEELYKKTEKTIDYIYTHLNTKAYLKGSRYYPSPDMFLFSVSRLIPLSQKFRMIFYMPLKQALKDRLNSTYCPLDLSFRILTSKKLQLQPNQEEVERLQQLQNKNGSWPLASFFKCGKKDVIFGSQELTTAFAIKALEE